MNIAFFIGSIYGGGAERVTCNLANYLHSRGHNVSIMIMAETPSSYLIHKGIKVIPLITNNERKNKLFDNSVRIYRLLRILLSNSFNLYIVMLPITTIILLFFSFIVKGKIIASERVDPNQYNCIIKWLLRLLSRFADGYVFQTKEAMRWYMDYVDNGKMIVIPNAVNKECIRPMYKGARNKEIVSVGRLTHQKNFTLLINSFRIICKKFPSHNLTIYGDGPLREELQKLIDSYELQDRIKLAGNVTDLFDRICKSELFVLSSDFEGMPNALMEAMALGLPCISTDCPIGGPKYLIRNKENGLLVSVNNVEELAKAINELLTNKILANKCAQNARMILDELSPEIIYKKWEDFILETVDK